MQFNHLVAPSVKFGCNGLYTLEHIPAGSLVWKYRQGEHKQLHSASEILRECKGFSPAHIRTYLSHCFSNEHHTVYHQSDLGRFTNHSYYPNLILSENQEDLIALYDIEADTELTVDYLFSGELDFPLWFYALCDIYRVDFSYLHPLPPGQRLPHDKILHNLRKSKK